MFSDTTLWTRSVSGQQKQRQGACDTTRAERDGGGIRVELERRCLCAGIHNTLSVYTAPAHYDPPSLWVGLVCEGMTAVRHPLSASQLLMGSK